MQLSMLQNKKISINGKQFDVEDETDNKYIINSNGKTWTISKLDIKVIKAMETLKMFEEKALEYSDKGYYLAFSGGKDSIVIHTLAMMAHVKFEAVHNHTTVDPPELIYFIRDNYPDVKVNYPEKTMWQLIEKKLMPPTRLVRYCCSELKEHGGDKRFVITGVRWAESAKRKNNRAKIETNSFSKKINKINDNDEARRQLENCQMRSKHILNPIIDWEDKDVWQFIHEKLGYTWTYPDLYDKGFDRLGCVGCPLATKEQRTKELEMYPRIKKAYITAFTKMIARRKTRGKPCEWKTGEEVYKWWLDGGVAKNRSHKNQIMMEV